MTIEPAAVAEHAADTVRFVFGAELADSLLEAARALLAGAPRELAESFEQAVHACRVDGTQA